MADLEKKVIVPVVGDTSDLDKKVDSSKKKASEEVTIPVSIDLSDVKRALNSIQGMIGKISGAFDKDFKLSGLKKELDNVSTKMDGLIKKTKKGVSYINVNPMGLEAMKEDISDITNNIKSLNDTKIDYTSFNKLADTLLRIETLVNSIVEGMNFDNIRPSTQIQTDIENTVAKLEELSKEEKKINKLESYLNKTGINAAKVFYRDGDFENAKVNLDNLIDKMREYIKAGGDLSKIEFKAFDIETGTKETHNLAEILDILGKLKNESIDVRFDEITNDVAVVKNLREELSKLESELDKAKNRENRDLNVSFDTKSIEKFTEAITEAFRAIEGLNLNIPEDFSFDGLSPENLEKITTKLDEIVTTIKNIGTLLSTGIDTSKLNIKELEVNVDPKVDSEEFAKKIEEQLKNTVAKIKVDLDIFSSKDKGDNPVIVDDEVISGIKSEFKNVTDDFGLNLQTEVSGIKENLVDVLGQINYENLFSDLRETLLNIVIQFQNSLNNVGFSSSQLDDVYKTLKGWNDADSFASKKADTTIGERGAFLNLKAGTSSNSFLVDASTSFRDVLFNALKELSVGIDGEISSIYDAWVHSHPFRKAIDGLKATGSDIGFSVADVEIGIEKLLKDKIPNMLVTNNYKFSKLDLSDVSEKLTQKFLEEYKKELLKAGLEEVIDNGKKKISFPSELAKHDKIYDLDIKSDILNGAMKQALTNVGLDSSRLTIGNIDDLKVDLSSLQQEEAGASDKAKELLGVLEKISNVLDNSDGKLQLGISEESLNGIIDKLTEISDLIKNLNTEKLSEANDNIQKIMYHYGNLNNGSKSHGFGDEITSYASGLRNGGRGWADGTGTYTTSDITQYINGDFSDSLKRFYAIDVSKLKMYEAHIEEEADAFYKFQHKLEQYAIALGSGFTGFDDNLGNITSEDLYAEAQKVFNKYPKIFTEVFSDFDEFDAFLDEMINLVSQSGINQDGSINPKKMYSFKQQFGNDDIKTRFMKKLGFDGINLSGTSYDTLKSGSVIYDIDSAEIVSKFKTVDDAISSLGLTAKQTAQDVSSISDTNTNVEATGMTYESEQADKLQQKIVEVTTAVDTKTRAFQDEEQVVTEVIQREISNLGALANQLLEVTHTVENLKTISDSLNFKIPDNISEIENTNKSNVSSGKFTQEFDNDIQQDLVMLENYKNTIKEIDALKLEPETEETKAKIEELNKLADYFASKISVIRGENGGDISPSMMEFSGQWNERLKKYPDNARNELYKLAKDKSGLQIRSVNTEFIGIDKEISNIESKSEELRLSLTKSMQDSIKYVKDLKYSFTTLAASQDELKTETNPKWIEGFNNDINKILTKFPELLQYKDKFTEDQALQFIKTNEWNEFLSTLPQAQEYLKSIGYSFEEIGTSTSIIEDVSSNISSENPTPQIINQQEQLKEAVLDTATAYEKMTEAEKEARKSAIQVAVNSIPQAENTARYVHWGNIDQSKSILSNPNGMSTGDYGLISSFADCLGEAETSMEAIYKYWDSLHAEGFDKGSALVIDIPLDEVKEFERGLKDNIPQEYIRGFVDTESNAITLNTTLQNGLKETAEQAEKTSQSVQDISKTPMKDVFQGDTNLSGIDKLEEKIKALFTDTNELQEILKSLHDGSYFDLSWVVDGVDKDGWLKINELKNTLEEYGYTIKNLKEDSEAWSTSGQIVPLKKEATEASTAIEEAINKLKEFQKYADNNINFRISFDNANEELEALNKKLQNGEISLEDYTNKVKEIGNSLKVIKNFDNDIENLQKSLKKSFSSDIGTERFVNGLKDISKVWKEITELNQKGFISDEEFSRLSGLFNSFKDSDIYSNSLGKIDKDNKLPEFIEKLKQAESQLELVKIALAKVESGEAFTDEDINNIKVYISQMRNLQKVSDSDKLGNINTKNNLLYNIQDFYQKNTAMSDELKQSFKELYNEIISGGDIAADKLKEFTNRFTALRAEAKRGKTGLSFFDGIIKKARTMSQNFISMYLSLYDIVRYIKTGITTITELDTALTEMRKVSDESTESLKRFQKASFDIAGAVGTTAKQIQNSTADWMEEILLSRYMVTYN